MTEGKPDGILKRFFASLHKAYFAITPSERFSITIILMLFLLGLLMKYAWLASEQPNTTPPTEAGIKNEAEE